MTGAICGTKIAGTGTETLERGYANCATASRALFSEQMLLLLFDAHHRLKYHHNPLSSDCLSRRQCLTGRGCKWLSWRANPNHQLPIANAKMVMRSNPSPRTMTLLQHERRFLTSLRVAHLATADTAGIPHVVPVCFVVRADTVYVTIDAKPKRKSANELKRIRNIMGNPRVAIVADRYDEDWTRLGWVMLQGRAEILNEGREHDEAQALLRSHYVQLETMRISAYPVIAIRIERATSWGDLSV
jgi:PPOX class probable F420-dependent enzyme